MRLNIISFILFVTFFSCNKTKSKYAQALNHLGGWNLRNTENTLRIDLDSITNPVLLNSKTEVVNDTIFFTFYNVNRHAIEIYNSINFNHFKRIRLFRNGPNSVVNISSYIIHSWDSIFIVDEPLNKIIIADSSGKVSNKISLNTSKLYKFSIDHFYRPYYDADRKVIGLWIYYDIDPAYPEFYQKAVNADISVMTGEIVNTFGGFPDSYKNENIYLIFNTINGYKTNEYVVNHYSKSHVIDIYNYGDKTPFKSIYAKSRFLPDIIPPLFKAGEEEPEIDEMQKYVIEGGNYMRMFTNAENTLHFRIVELNKDYTKDVNLDYRPFSIMIFNANFDLLTEHEFRGDKYNMFDVFAIGNKLYVSQNNVLNKNFSEDQLVYDVYEVSHE